MLKRVSKLLGPKDHDSATRANGDCRASLQTNTSTMPKGCSPPDELAYESAADTGLRLTDARCVEVCNGLPVGSRVSVAAGETNAESSRQWVMTGDRCSDMNAVVGTLGTDFYKTVELNDSERRICAESMARLEATDKLHLVDDPFSANCALSIADPSAQRRWALMKEDRLGLGDAFSTRTLSDQSDESCRLDSPSDAVTSSSCCHSAVQPCELADFRPDGYADPELSAPDNGMPECQSLPVCVDEVDCFVEMACVSSMPMHRRHVITEAVGSLIASGDLGFENNVQLVPAKAVTEPRTTSATAEAVSLDEIDSFIAARPDDESTARERVEYIAADGASVSDMFADASPDGGTTSAYELVSYASIPRGALLGVGVGLRAAQGGSQGGARGLQGGARASQGAARGSQVGARGTGCVGDEQREDDKGSAMSDEGFNSQGLRQARQSPREPDAVIDGFEIELTRISGRLDMKNEILRLIGRMGEECDGSLEGRGVLQGTAAQGVESSVSGVEADVGQADSLARRDTRCTEAADGTLRPGCSVAPPPNQSSDNSASTATSSSVPRAVDANLAGDYDDAEYMPPPLPVRNYPLVGCRYQEEDWEEGEELGAGSGWWGDEPLTGQEAWRGELGHKARDDEVVVREPKDLNRPVKGVGRHLRESLKSAARSEGGVSVEVAVKGCDLVSGKQSGPCESLELALEKAPAVLTPGCRKVKMLDAVATGNYLNTATANQLNTATVNNLNTANVSSAVPDPWFKKDPAVTAASSCSADASIADVAPAATCDSACVADVTTLKCYAYRCKCPRHSMGLVTGGAEFGSDEALMPTSACDRLSAHAAAMACPPAAPSGGDRIPRKSSLRKRLSFKELFERKPKRSGSRKNIESRGEAGLRGADAGLRGAEAGSRGAAAELRGAKSSEILSSTAIDPEIGASRVTSEDRATAGQSRVVCSATLPRKHKVNVAGDVRHGAGSANHATDSNDELDTDRPPVVPRRFTVASRASVYEVSRVTGGAAPMLPNRPQTTYVDSAISGGAFAAKDKKPTKSLLRKFSNACSSLRSRLSIKTQSRGSGTDAGTSRAQSVDIVHRREVAASVACSGSSDLLGAGSSIHATELQARGGSAMSQRSAEMCHDVAWHSHDSNTAVGDLVVRGSNGEDAGITDALGGQANVAGSILLTSTGSMGQNSGQSSQGRVRRMSGVENDESGEGGVPGLGDGTAMAVGSGGVQGSATGNQAEFIQSLCQLKECGWYWGPLGWEEAESELAGLSDGSFLVRDSSDEHYILSLTFRSQGSTHHTRIEHYKGMFSFFSQPKSHGVATIVEFIERAMAHSRSGKFLYFLRPRGAGHPPAPVQLLYPVSRFARVQSLQHACRFVILKQVRRDHVEMLPLPARLQEYLLQTQYYTEYRGVDG